MTENGQKLENMEINSSYRTKKIVLLSLISAIAYAVVFVFRIPIIPSVPFLDLELKSAVILIGSYIFGPLSGFVMAVVISFIEMLTISSTGVIGCIMNILATSCFVCPAAFVYKRKRTVGSAIIGLAAGTFLMTVAMVLWNYLITPIYMGIPREAIVELLLPAFVPFNLLKGVINGAAAVLLYRFVFMALKRADLIPAVDDKKRSKASVAGVVIASILVIVTCVLIIFVFNGLL